MCSCFSLPHFSTFDHHQLWRSCVCVCKCVFDKCMPMCCQISWKKSAKLFNVQTFDTNTNKIFIFAWCFRFLPISFYVLFLRFVCILYTLYSWGFTLYSTIAITATPVITHRHSFYCERFKFIRVYCLEILTSTLVHAVLVTATAGVTTVDAKYFSVGVCVRVSARVTMDWKINMWRNSILQVQNHRR